ncbi:MAG: DUF389 domain-containing protein [Bacteroidales bacterium]|nr:DUF389 domain-containing protein [Bacteroidales bacterium]
MGRDLRRHTRYISHYFNLMHDREDEQEVVEQVRGSIVFRGTNLWILIFAILIASLGLNVNSTAVIIGAMLVSPLMGPIIGMGLAVGISDFELLKQSLKNYAVATLISVATATLYFWLSPLSEAQSELLARTSPTLYDVLIAFCGGAAGVLALTCKSKGQVIPGVAIATALMPPLCTAGYGLATAQWSYFLGAFYLFFINTVFIATATFLGTKLLRFHPVQAVNPERARHGRRVITAIVVVTLIPAAVMTVSIVRKNVFERNLRAFVTTELDRSGRQILSQQLAHDTLRVVAVGREITQDEMAQARGRMHFYGLAGYQLSVIQADAADERYDLTSHLTLAEQNNAQLNAELADLQQRLDAYTALDSLSAHVSREARPLFPSVESIAVGRIAGRTVALVALHDKRPLPAAERQRLEQWLRTRAEEPRLETIIQQNI